MWRGPSPSYGTVIFAAERVLKKLTIQGKTEYLIKRAGYPLKDSIRESEENVIDRRLVENFSLGQLPRRLRKRG